MKTAKYVLMGIVTIAVLALSLDAGAIIGQNYKKALSHNNIVKGKKGSKYSGNRAVKGEQLTKTKHIYLMSLSDESAILSSLNSGDIIYVHMQNDSGWSQKWTKGSVCNGGCSTVSESIQQNSSFTGFVGSCGGFIKSYESGSSTGNTIYKLTYSKPSEVSIYDGGDCGTKLQCVGSCPAEESRWAEVCGSGDPNGGSGSYITSGSFECSGYSGCSCEWIRNTCESGKVVPPCKLHIGGKTGSTEINKTIQIGKQFTPCDSSYQYTCEGTHIKGGFGGDCYGKYASCTCDDGYQFENGQCKVCGSDFKYTCRGSLFPNASGGDGEKCGVYYKKCLCKTGYVWNNTNCIVNGSEDCGSGSGSGSGCSGSGS